MTYSILCHLWKRTKMEKKKSLLVPPLPVKIENSDEATFNITAEGLMPPSATSAASFHTSAQSIFSMSTFKRKHSDGGASFDDTNMEEEEGSIPLPPTSFNSAVAHHRRCRDPILRVERRVMFVRCHGSPRQNPSSCSKRSKIEDTAPTSFHNDTALVTCRLLDVESSTMENIGFGSYDFVFGCNNWAKADMDAALKVNMNAAIPSLNALKIKKSFQSLLSGHDDKFTNLSVQELSDKLMENGVTAPETKNSHSDPHSFNLMFQTSIGSSGLALAFPFDGVLGVSAYALSSHSAEMWSTDFDREESMVAVDLKSVGTHKISHVCGLGYYSLKEAVMYPNSTFGSLFQSNSSAQNLLLGLLWMQSTYVGHDSGHHKVMLSHGYNAFTQIIYGNCLPKISIAWKWIHNADHNVCNILDYDPDLQHIPLFDVPHLRNWSKRIMFVLACFVVCSIQHLQCCLNHFASSVCVPGHHMPMTALRSRQGGTLDISCSS